MKAILLLVLSAVILSQSYGFAYADHGGNHYAVGSGGIGTITVGTNSSSYTTGEMINVSGSVSEYDESDPEGSAKALNEFTSDKGRFKDTLEMLAKSVAQNAHPRYEL